MVALRAFTILIAAALLQGCGESNPVFHASDSPLRLSEWNLFTVEQGQLIPNSASLTFTPANTLFSDYAHKLRTVWIPDGQHISLDDNELDYPVGTVLSKTFYYSSDSQGRLLKSVGNTEVASIALAENQLIETRLLIRRENAWVGLPYVWNAEQSEAFLRVAGSSLAVDLVDDTETESFRYFVPNENQCAGCHTIEHPDGGMHPLGAIAQQLQIQVEHFQERGWLTDLPLLHEQVSWEDESAETALRARAYLNMNCGHCHNPTGPADTSALLLDGMSHPLADMGLCKPPIAAGGGSGGLRFGIVPGQPQESILLFRMQSDNPAVMMPELGRTLVHREGVELIRRWIGELSGSCN